MAFRANHSWTLVGLICAYLDLTLAYFLLCGSTIAFFISKFLHLFGLPLPCPCTGFLGFRCCELCLHKLLIDWPVSVILSVQDLAKNSFSFDSICFEDQEHQSNLKFLTDKKCETGLLELNDESCSSSFPGPKVQKSADKESGCDVKEKKTMNQKQRVANRRRRRANFGYGKSSSILPSDAMQSVVAGGSTSISDGEIIESRGPVSEIDDVLQDEKNAATSSDLDERGWNGFELNGSYLEADRREKDSSSVESSMSKAEGTPGISGDEKNVIRLLEQALQGEKAACAALYMELEEERASAATAADEAMAMILRLQEDKASLEMESRQYERMMEEKYAYDEEEMNILKEILVRREREIHFLEKELGAYRQMNDLRNEPSEGEFSCIINKGERELSPSPVLDEDPALVIQHTENSKEMGNWLSNLEASSADKLNQTCAFAKPGAPRSKDLDSSASQGLVQMWEKSSDSYEISPDNHDLHSVERKEVIKDDKEVYEGLTTGAVQSSGAIERNLSLDKDWQEKDGEYGVQVWLSEHGPILDKEPIVYDVHVIDDKAELWEVNERESGRLNCVASGCGVWNDEPLCDSHIRNMTKTKPDIPRSSSSTSGRLGMSSSSVNRNSSTISSERLKLDSEVDWLRERLRKVQEEKEKLTFTAEHRERVNAQLKLMEEIMNQLREIQQVREPIEELSLPVQF